MFAGRTVAAALVPTALLVAVLGVPVAGAATAFATPVHPVTHLTSINWAGYAVRTSKGAVTDVKGSWVVPKLTCPAKGHLYSSFWVGIDGDGSSTVEQTGTESDCAHGASSNYAWFEFYPAFPKAASLTISTGDRMSAEVSYARGTFLATITDHTTGKSASTTSTISAQRSSAEWIAEAPSSSSGVLPLADFGTGHFGNDSTGVRSTCGAKISGTFHLLGSIAGRTAITMVSLAGKTKASPSAVSSDGTSFSVSWASAGP